MRDCHIVIVIVLATTLCVIVEKNHYFPITISNNVKFEISGEDASFSQHESLIIR